MGGTRAFYKKTSKISDRENVKARHMNLGLLRHPFLPLHEAIEQYMVLVSTACDVTSRDCD